MSGRDVDFCVESTFHNVEYTVSVYTSNNESLVVLIEEKSSGHTWRGEFSARYIEEITHKTGNFKKFGVFVKMLVTSLTQSSETVFCDLLTYADLEVLKNRRNVRKGGMNNSTMSNASGAAGHGQKSSKRYLILTYAVEFDRVHYPLPLSFEEVPDARTLQKTVKRLRGELEQRRAAEGDLSSYEANKLVKENEALKMKLRSMETYEGGLKVSTKVHNDEIKMLQEELALSNREKEELEATLDRTRRESNKQIRAMQKECEALADKLDAQAMDMSGLRRRMIEDGTLPGDVRNLQKQIVNLQDQMTEERSSHKKAMTKKKKELDQVLDELDKVRDSERKLRTKIRELNHEMELQRKRNAVASRGRQTYQPPSRNSGGRANTPSYMAPVHRPSSAPTNYGRTPSAERARRPSSASSRASSTGSRNGSTDRQRPIRPSSAERARKESPSAGRPSSADRQRQLERQRAAANRSIERQRAARGELKPSSARDTSVRSDRSGRATPTRSARTPSPGLRERKTQRHSGEYNSNIYTGAQASGTGKRSAKSPGSHGMNRVAGSSGGAGQDENSRMYGAAKDKTSAEISDIDARLNALQNFLKQAKANSGRYK